MSCEAIVNASPGRSLTACALGKEKMAENAAINLQRSHFMFGDVLGEGSYAKVVYAKMKSDPSREYAMKILDKYHIKKENKVNHNETFIIEFSQYKCTN
jgi:hypothetical protein